MASNKNNLTLEKTSFLQGVNSPFIEKLYQKYLVNPNDVPQSWKDFFEGLNEDKNVVYKELSGPSWSPKKSNILNNDFNEIFKAEEQNLIKNNLEKE